MICGETPHTGVGKIPWKVGPGNNGGKKCLRLAMPSNRRRASRVSVANPVLTKDLGDVCLVLLVLIV